MAAAPVEDVQSRIRREIQEFLNQRLTRKYAFTVLETFHPGSLAHNDILPDIMYKTDDDPRFIGILTQRIDAHPEEWKPYAHALVYQTLDLLEISLPLIKVFTRHGVNFTGQLDDGTYMFHHTTDPVLVKWLLEAGANPDVPSNRPPLTAYAITSLYRYDYNVLNSMMLLLAAGADPAQQDHDGDTAMHAILTILNKNHNHFRMNGGPVNYMGACLLIAAGAPMDLENNTGVVPSDLYIDVAVKIPDFAPTCSEEKQEQLRTQLAEVKASLRLPEYNAYGAPMAASAATAAYASAATNRNNEKQEGGRRRRPRKTHRKQKKAKKAKKTHRRRR